MVDNNVRVPDCPICHRDHTLKPYDPNSKALHQASRLLSSVKASQQEERTVASEERRENVQRLVSLINEGRRGQR